MGAWLSVGTANSITMFRMELRGAAGWHHRWLEVGCLRAIFQIIRIRLFHHTEELVLSYCFLISWFLTWNFSIDLVLR